MTFSSLPAGMPPHQQGPRALPCWPVAPLAAGQETHEGEPGSMFPRKHLQADTTIPLACSFKCCAYSRHRAGADW